MLTKAFIPYRGYYSTPFVKWQGTLANENAIALGARTAAELGDDARTQAYFAVADKDYPDNPTPGILRHIIAIAVGNKTAASEAADALVASYGSNPNVVRTLISTW